MASMVTRPSPLVGPTPVARLQGKGRRATGVRQARRSRSDILCVPRNGFINHGKIYPARDLPLWGTITDQAGRACRISAVGERTESVSERGFASSLRSCPHGPAHHVHQFLDRSSGAGQCGHVDSVVARLRVKETAPCGTRSVAKKTPRTVSDQEGLKRK